MMAKEISQLLAQQAENVVKHLLPAGKKVGHEWRVGSIQGVSGESLGIHLHGAKAGIWCDFAEGNRGDLLDLWCQIRRISITEALSQAKQWLGIPITQFTPIGAPRPSKTIQKNWQSLQLDSKVSNYLQKQRKLSQDVLNKYLIGEQQNWIIFPYWRDGNYVQAKRLSVERIKQKKQIRVEPGCNAFLFGWQAIPSDARSVVICEGEIDAMSLYQYGFPALSVPFGGGKGDKHKWIENEFDKLSIFDEIYLCFDNDDAGHQAITCLIERLGHHRCKVVRLPMKDANECLQNGMTSNEIKICFGQADSLTPIELKSAHVYVDQVIDEFYPPEGIKLGINPPWDKAKGKILFRPAELSIWTGINGHGKSQFIGHILLSSIKQNTKVCIASLELKPQRLLMRLTRQAAALSTPTKDYIKHIHQWFQDKLWLFDLVGTAKVKRLLEVFLYARQRYGVDTFVIDSFLKLDIAEDDYRQQKDFIEKLCDFKNEYNCHIHLIIHPRKGIDENKFPGKMDIKGSGSVTDLADNCFTIWRNKHKEIETQKWISQKQDIPSNLIEQADCLWICDKQRNGDWEGRIGLWFEPNSFQYLNNQGQKAQRYVDYTNLNQ